LEREVNSKQNSYNTSYNTQIMLPYYLRKIKVMKILKIGSVLTKLSPTVSGPHSTVYFQLSDAASIL